MSGLEGNGNGNWTNAFRAIIVAMFTVILGLIGWIASNITGTLDMINARVEQAATRSELAETVHRIDRLADREEQNEKALAKLEQAVSDLPRR